ncbi:mannan-binding lectin [Luedemannella helvata]|uniref:Mannan-binding protein domain-containing protein n=1 Tax=Luedemannella helvata TaxID=349315 RepID=A0ABP4VTQ0_9ACTN
MDRRVFLLGAAIAPVAAHLPAFADPASAAVAARADTPTFTVNVPAGPLADNAAAQRIGPAIAAAHRGRYTGQWTTVVPGSMSVVEIELPAARTGATEHTMDVLAGPIWNNADAQAKCPAICASYGGTWNGQWTTVAPGRMSVAGCTFRF